MSTDKPTEPTGTNRSLLRSTGIISFATATSRVLGFFRDVLIAKYFGTGIPAQAFVVAFRLPNMLRDLIAEGAADAAVVPILSEYRETRTKEEYWEVAGIILKLMLLVLLFLAAMGMIFAPLFVRVMAPGFIGDPEKFALTVSLTRMLFPYLVLVGMVAYCKGVLNSLHYFVTPAFSPVVLNVTMITVLFVLCPVIGVKGMVIGVLLGGTFEVLLQVPAMRAKGFRFSRGFKIVHPVATRIGKLLMPRALGSAVYQLGVMISTIFASLAWIVGEGGVAALYFSNRLIQLPFAIFGVALATAALPKMSKEVASGDTQKLKDTISFGMRVVLTVMIPAMVGLLVLCRPMVRVLFQRGEFSAYSAGITTDALFFSAFGLFAYSGSKILISAFYAMGDTKTPVKTAVAGLTVNFILNLILMWPMRIGGLALATSIAAITNFILLYAGMSARVGDIGTRQIVRSTLRVCSAAVVMAVFLAAGSAAFLKPDSASTLIHVLRLLSVIAAGTFIYFIAAYFFGSEVVRKMAGAIRAKFTAISC